MVRHFGDKNLNCIGGTFSNNGERLLHLKFCGDHRTYSASKRAGCDF